MDRIRILFHNTDQAGVNYFRTLTPATELDRNHSNEFHVEINPSINFTKPEVLDYLKGFDIIHYHRQFGGDVNLFNQLKGLGIKLVVDIDDYWDLHKDHPYYNLSIERNSREIILNNLRMADYVTTTTDIFADEVRSVSGKNNVEVFYNSIDPLWMRQFQNNWKPDPDGRVRITYMGGSSHLKDLEQLGGVINVLSNNSETKDKFKIILAGWDSEGNTTDFTFNQEFGAELKKRGLWDQGMVNAINRTRGDIDKIAKIPQELRDRYRGKVFHTKNRPIKSEESTYYAYEKILTDNHRIIRDNNYLQWLHNFERDVRYPDEGCFGRRWTEKANTYANVLNETDIVIAPLANNKFNTMKSNLKQTECWTRKLPVVCSDIPPYNVHGKHMENCILIPSEKNAHKYWVKHLKRLILDADLRAELGEGLYNDFKESHGLESVTKKRAEFYKSLINKKLISMENA